MLEMTIIVAMVTQLYRLDLVPGHPVDPKPMVTLRPRYGMPMIITPRASEGRAPNRAEAAAAAPVPRGHPVLGNTLGFKNDILGTLMAGYREYGDIVKFRGVGPLFPIYLFAHPDFAMHALKDHADNYPRTPLVRSKWRMVVGDGLICIEGDHWRSQRKLAQPSFDPKLLQSFDGLMADETDALLEGWADHAERGETIDVAREMTHLALANIGGAMFSTDWREEALVMADAVEDRRSTRLNSSHEWR